MTNTESVPKLLLAAIRQEAAREEFPIDQEVYTAVGLNPLEPIVYAGNLQSRLCFFARDLGKDEVKARQPLYGAAGKLVRGGLYRRLFGKESQDAKELEAVLSQVLLTNTVPFKPPGNKAYAANVKERFRPFLEQLLVCHWQGAWIIPLGAEALEWFMPYDPQVAAFTKDAERFTKTVTITLQAKDETGKSTSRQVTLAPLPHPSPLNQKYYAQFPAMLQERLQAIFGGKA